MNGWVPHEVREYVHRRGIILQQVFTTSGLMHEGGLIMMK